ncbi:MAG: hypothetical protein NUW37_19450 [Planctomycetes bacterium]|nr:hypothetical protein [Planctomycetota bacterium]
MIPKVQVSKRLRDDIASLREIDESKLWSVLHKFKSLPNDLVTPEKIIKLITEFGDLKPEQSEKLFGVAASIWNLISQQGYKLKDAFSDVFDAVSIQWSDEQKEKWRGIEPILTEFFSLDVIRIATSAVELALENANILRASRILTDVRPVFSVDGKIIQAAVVTNSLRLIYTSIDGPHTLCLNLDMEDLKKLKTQCERALTKSETTKVLMSDVAKISTLVTGENSVEGD